MRELASSVSGPCATYDVREVCAEGDAPGLLVLTRTSFASTRISSQAAVWDLSVREADVLAHIATGMSNKQIATAMRIAEVTVENHLTRIYRKARVQSRGELLACLLGAELRRDGARVR